MEVAVNWAQMENLKGLHFSCCNLWLRGLDHLKDRREKDNFFRDEMLPEDTQNFMDWEKNKCQYPRTTRPAIEEDELKRVGIEDSCCCDHCGMILPLTSLSDYNSDKWILKTPWRRTLLSVYLSFVYAFASLGLQAFVHTEWIHNLSPPQFNKTNLAVSTAGGQPILLEDGSDEDAEAMTQEGTVVVLVTKDVMDTLSPASAKFVRTVMSTLKRSVLPIFRIFAEIRNFCSPWKFLYLVFQLQEKKSSKKFFFR